MAEASLALVSFNAGEWSPKMWSRADQAKAGSACRVLENMIVETYGQVRRRAGTRKIALSNNTFITGVPPTGPEGVTLSVNRTTYLGTELPILSGDFGCITSETTYDMTFVSRAGSACLCGIDTFVTSTPTRRFLTMSQSAGTVYRDGLTISEYGYEFRYFDTDQSQTCSTAPCAGIPGLAYTYHGHSENFTCTAGGDGGGGSGVRDGAEIATSYALYDLSSVSETTWTIGSQAITLGCMTPPTRPASDIVFTLTDEDTFAKALARAGAPTSGEIDSLLATEVTAGCFTGHSSEWTTVFTDLKVGCHYSFTVTYVRSDSTTVTTTTSFVATGTTETLTQEVPNAPVGITTTTASGELGLTPPT